MWTLWSVRGCSLTQKDKHVVVVAIPFRTGEHMSRHHHTLLAVDAVGGLIARMSCRCLASLSHHSESVNKKVIVFLLGCRCITAKMNISTIRYLQITKQPLMVKIDLSILSIALECFDKGSCRERCIGRSNPRCLIC